MFGAPVDLPFWDFFSDQVRQFEFATRNMPKEDVYHLVDEKGKFYNYFKSHWFTFQVNLWLPEIKFL